jgi:hypothetical protein|tara:strand:- start:213 stop:563 length:351 start_codon:yes stop_codon:yes gene_type:complete
MKSTGLCSSKLLLLLLVIVLTIVVVNIALNSFNKDMFSNINSNSNIGSTALFHSNLLPQTLQNQVNQVNKWNSASADNNLLSAKHLTHVYETRRPELISPNNRSPEKLCYIDLDSL